MRPVRRCVTFAIVMVPLSVKILPEIPQATPQSVQLRLPFARDSSPRSYERAAHRLQAFVSLHFDILEKNRKLDRVQTGCAKASGQADRSVLDRAQHLKPAICRYQPGF